MRRAIALGFLLLAAMFEVAGAGGAKAVPPVQVVAPTSAGGIKLERDDLPGPQPEVAAHPGKVDTPVIPAFELPASEPGFHSARELRVRGKPLRGTEIKVKGYVTWVYDCAKALAGANPRATAAQIQAAIQKDPGLCERPMFSLGDAPDTLRDMSIVVAAARPGSPEPGKPQEVRPAPSPAMPGVSVGDYLVVTGTWGAERPQRDSEGVLVFAGLERAVPGTAAAIEPVPALKEMEIDIDGEKTVPMRKFVDDQTLNTSVGHLNACNKAIGTKQYDAAIAECREAIKIWEDNHLAWYAWASAHMARREWPQARAALEHAVTLRPDQAMYQMYHGIVLYEAAHQQAREERARKDGKKPEEVEIDPSAINLDAARDALTTALKTAPEMWRAHYYLGRVYRDLDDARHAAVQFTATIKTHPAYRPAYVALIELYRRWGYLDQALALAMLGTANVAGAEAAELWFEVGVAHDARHADDKALEAFGRAIASKPDDASSKFQRAQLYLRKGDLVNARRDLEDVARSTDPRVGAAKQLAAQFLEQLASAKDGAPPRMPPWDCRRSATGTMIVCRPR